MCVCACVHVCVCMVCISDLLSTKEPRKIEVALKVAEDLVRSKPSDLKEVSE